jgi:putative oxidoreductase
MNRDQELGALLLRIALGVIFIAHSVYLKLFVFTLPGTAQFFESLGLPGLSAYMVFAVEALGGIALLLGIEVRPVAVVLALISAGATWAHLDAGWLFSNNGGGWEYPAFLTVTALVQALLGPGAYRVRVPLYRRAVAGEAA